MKKYIIPLIAFCAVSSTHAQPETLSAYQNTKPSATLAVNQEISERKAQGLPTFTFGIGQSPLPAPRALMEGLSKHANERNYPNIQGAQETRDAIAEFHNKNYGLELTPEGIFIFPGSKKAIFEILSILDGPLLIPQASWVSYEPQAKINNKAVHWILTKEKDDYKVTPSALARILSTMDPAEQKIMILNSPSNPAGYIYSREELMDLAILCKKNNIIVIHDIIYAFPNDYNNEPFTTMAHVYPENTILTSGISKIFSAAGWRMGFITIPNSKDWNDFAKAVKFKIGLSLSGVSAPIQLAAAEVYSSESTLEYLETAQRIHKATTRYMAERFQRMNVTCPTPEGAFYVLPSFQKHAKALHSQGIHSGKDLAQQFKNLGIFAVPGESFGLYPDSFTIRFALVDYDGPVTFDAVQDMSNNEAISSEFITTYMPHLIEACDIIENYISNI